MADLDHTPLTFGKYAGQTPDEISEHDPSYIVWMYETLEPKRCSDFLYQYCLEDVYFLYQDPLEDINEEDGEYDGPF